MSQPRPPEPVEAPPPRRRRSLLTRLRPQHVPRAGRHAVRRWQDYRERQLALLAESNRLQRELHDHVVHPRTGTGTGTARTGGTTQGRAAAHGGDATDVGVAVPTGADPGAAGPGPGADDPRGVRATSLASPFYVGFTFALGALVAWLLVENLTRLTSVLTFLLVAVFLTLALEPIVQWLTRHGVPRFGAVFVVFLGLVGAVALVASLVVPPIASQAAMLVDKTPDYVQRITTTPWIAELDAQHDVFGRITEEIESFAVDRATISTVFGGVLGAAGWVAGSLVGVLTSGILTLYMLATLPSVKDAAFRMVPRSRRRGVRVIAEEIMRRVGSYALGQGAVATINGVCSWIMMKILDVPYPEMLAVLVGLLGLIPLVGATLGAVVVALAALTVSPTTALIVVVYYIIYQQFENYVIVPNIMRRTVSVPGAVTVVAVLVGGTLLGVLGALIAIPVAAGLLLIYHEVLVPRQERA
ncbi:AI-2E family transporter [Ornithinimicrobium avium]|uniref:AI-2E family transporter n=1 Tax=Ornithinimicrobium avium TaxID=2283195 RepID=A0A345NM55_9MICO|nr:AI-2E family transporter [Ornithinimicrobium avium]AXH96113.1 AI-2E family transporter [Ornithinimicrobium avium]